MPFLTRVDKVWILNLGETNNSIDTENRFTSEWISEVLDLFTEVKNTSGPAALVVTATGKFFSNGLEVTELLNPEVQLSYLKKVHSVLLQLLVMDVPTVAAINGHAFGGGALLALCADWRIMRTERGFFSLPESQLQMPLTQGMAALVAAKLTPNIALEVALTSKRYTAEAAQEAGIITAAVSNSELESAAITKVASLVEFRGKHIAQTKLGLYASVVEKLIASASLFPTDIEK